MRQSPQSYQEEFKRLDIDMQSWIYMRLAHRMPASQHTAVAELAETVEQYDALLDKLGMNSEGGLVYVVDTNILIDFPDPVEWTEMLSEDAFTVIVPPSVVTELDNLKKGHRDPKIRKRIRRLISTIKEWRRDGSLLEGVELNKNIQVRMIAVDPSFDGAPSWLNENNDDDRLIATTLDVQRDIPTAEVIILTNDLNLQNKAELALIPYAEIATEEPGS